MINKPKKDSFTRRIYEKTTHLSSSLKIILSIVIIVTLWMLTGIFKAKDSALHKPEAGTVKVKVIHSLAQGRQATITLNGYTKAYQSVDIKPEIDGYVIEVIAKNGQFLKKDDAIARIEPDNKRQALKKAEAEMEKHKLNYQAAKTIYDKKLSSEVALKDALANLKGAESVLNQAILDLKKTLIKAPFDGYIDEVLVHNGDLVSIMQNSVIAKFTSVNPLLAVVFLPQAKIGMIKNGSAVQVTVDGNKTIDGKIVFVSKVANNNTRTFQVEALVDNSSEVLHVGESVRLQAFLSNNKRSHKIPKSSLILDTEGIISVKIVDDNNTVRTVPVQIMDEDSGSFWIDGLPNEVNIITLGNGYVKDGEAVSIDYTDS